MFALRTISGNGLEHNQAIGQSYTHIHRAFNYNQFCESFEIVFKRKHVVDLDPTADEYTKETHGFIVTEGGQKIIPLYRKQKAYIMTESGKTFDNVSADE